MRLLGSIFSNPKFYFFSVASLLLATAFIKVPCPVCGGSGTTGESVGMADVQVLSVDSRILSVTTDSCSNYNLVQANPMINVTNVGNIEAKGWLKVDLVDEQNNNILASQYLAVDVEPTMVDDIEYPVVFGWPAENALPANVVIKASVLDTNAACLACNGTGRVPMSLYLLDKAFKDTFVQRTQAQHPFVQVQQVGGLEPWEMD